MEQVLQKFKNLYAGNEVFKKHILYLLLLIIPAMIGSLQYIFDDNAPKELLLIGLTIFAILSLGGIVAYILLLGFIGEFYEDRIHDKVGLPKLNFEMFFKGLKMLLLVLVWGFYTLILMSVIFIIPMVVLIVGFASAASSLDSSSSIGAISGFILIMLLLFVILFAVIMVLAPFLNYVYCSFVEDYEYRAEYFNPFIIFTYMKKVFKQTMFTMLKFLLAGIVVGMVASTISTIFILIGVVLGAGAGSLSVKDIETAAFSPVALMFILPVCTIGTLITSYASSMTRFAASDAYIEIYKSEIRLPDPLDNKENEEQEVSQQDEQNGGWVE